MQRIHFNEVVTRDGFQNEPAFVPTDAKVALIDELSACGYAKIEVTSFTSAKAIPMLRDAEEVMGRMRRVPGVETTVLVPNVRGAERALECRADELNLVMSTSETHNLANLRMPREKSFAALAEVIRLVNGRTPINVSLSCCFGCPMEGDVALAEVLSPTILTSTRTFLLIEEGSMSIWAFRERGLKSAMRPVMRSSNRAPTLIIRSQPCMARFAS